MTIRCLASSINARIDHCVLTTVLYTVVTCSKIGSKGHVMLVGDSLNHEISWAVMNALVPNATGYQNLNSNIRKVPEPFEMCGDILGEGNGFNVSFVRNDRLSPVVDDNIDGWGNFYDYSWLHLLGELGIKTLLLNRGAHYEDDEKYTNALRTIFTILSLQHPQIHVIYRNTQPGKIFPPHVCCSMVL